MDPSELLRIVDTIHRDKNIDKEIVFEGIEAAIVTAAKKHYGEEEEVQVKIDRRTGLISGHAQRHRHGAGRDQRADRRPGGQAGDDPEDPRGRARPPLQRIRRTRGQLVTGTIQRYEGGAATVSLQNVEAILPRGEQIPGETHHVNERVRATVYEVRRRAAA